MNDIERCAVLGCKEDAEYHNVIVMSREGINIKTNLCLVHKIILEGKITLKEYFQKKEKKR